MSDEQFAYGDNEVDGCLCPAVTAGVCPLDKQAVNLIAGSYDDIMIESEGTLEGVISEEQAKEAWMKAIGRHSGPTAKEGMEIAYKLGWIDDE